MTQQKTNEKLNFPKVGLGYEVHSISFQTFFVQAFIIAVNSRYFSMLLLYSL